SKSFAPRARTRWHILVQKGKCGSKTPIPFDQARYLPTTSAVKGRALLLATLRVVRFVSRTPPQRPVSRIVDTGSARWEHCRPPASPPLRGRGVRIPQATTPKPRAERSLSRPSRYFQRLIPAGAPQR